MCPNSGGWWGRAGARARGMVKKALCCGLNYPKQKYQLYGCINDCLDWEHLLKNTFGFDETRVLIDQNPDGSLCTAPTQIPTRANILAQLGGWLCAGNSPGDCLVFVFAGHGCQVRNSYGQIDEALVPEDWESPDEHGVQPLVMDDELHALFARLPAGSFLTVVLDCCHSSHMLDVSCCMDASSRPPQTVQVSERPREVQNRTDEAWSKSLIKHASARPRFVPTISSSGPRQRRTPDGAGAHVGRMTLDPGVTAFCFAAARTPEAALDANIKAHQRGVMSFCLLEALSALRNRCTYEMLLEKASAKMDDIREKYMPSMDQHIQLTFCPNSAPSEVVVLDARYAGVAQHRISQRARMAEQNQSDGLMSADGYPAPVREVSTEFVPSPMYNPPERGQASGGGPSYQPSVGGPPAGAPAPASAPGPPTGTMPPSEASYRGPPVNSVAVGTLYLVIHAGYNLLYRDTGCEPHVVARVGHQEHKTPTIHNSAHPVWSEGNRLTFHVGERDGQLELEAMNGYSSLGRTNIDLRSLPPGQWHRRREALRDGAGGELEFDVRLEPSQGHGHGGRSPQGQSPQGYSQPAQANQNSYSNARARPPSPVRQQSPQDFGRTYSEQCSGAGVGAALDGPCAPTASLASGPSTLGGLGPGPCGGLSPQPSLVPPPVYPEGGNMFGTPNLFGAMPNLMSGMLANAGAPPPSLGGSNGAVPPALQMPNRALSGQAPAGLGGPFAAPGGTPTAAGRPQSLGLPGAQANFGGAPQPGLPSATIGIDINLNGRTDLVVSGVDLNRDGIPDILQQGSQASGGGFPAAQAGGGGFSAAPVPAPLPVSGQAIGQLPPPAVYNPAPGPVPGSTWEPVARPGVYAQPPVAIGAQLGNAPSAGVLGGYSCPYPRNSRLY